MPEWWWFSAYAQCGANVATSKKLFCHTHILAASERTATDSFLRNLGGVGNALINQESVL